MALFNLIKLPKHKHKGMFWRSFQFLYFVLFLFVTTIYVIISFLFVIETLGLFCLIEQLDIVLYLWEIVLFNKQLFSSSQ